MVNYKLVIYIYMGASIAFSFLHQDFSKCDTVKNDLKSIMDNDNVFIFG